MDYKKTVMLVSAIVVIFALVFIQIRRHPYEYVVIDSIKIELHKDYRIEEYLEQVYIYLPINFKAEDVKMKLYVGDEEVSDYPLKKLIQKIDPFTPQEFSEEININNKIVEVHVIVQ